MKHYRMVCISYLLLGGVFSLLSLSGTGCEEKMQTKNNMKGAVELPGDTIAKMSTKRILFGHVSVGNNIVAGLEDIKAKDNGFDRLVIKKIESAQEVNGAGFYHCIVKRNRFPKEKCDNFKRMLMENRLGERLDIAFFKFCYVDIEKDTDVEGLFQYYVKTIKEIREAFPNLKVLHVTAPLYSHGMGLKGFLKGLVKTDYHNIKRNEYNQKLRDKFAGVDPIYDLAAVESTYPDGSRSSFEHNGQTYFSLANEYTHDGGHLNETGRIRAAQSLVEVLGKIVD